MRRSLGRRPRFGLTRSRVPLAVLLALAAVVAGACSGQGAGEGVNTETADASGEPESDAPSQASSEAPTTSEPITIAVGFNPFWSLPPFFVGRELGYFDDLEGIEVEWSEFDAPTAAVAAIASGDIQVAAGPGPTLLSARSRGINVVGVASLAGESDPAQYGFVVRSDAGLSTVADLEGKIVGVNNFAGNFDLHLRYMLEQEGLDPATDVDIIVTPIAAVVPAVLEGSIDTGAVVGAGMLIAEGNEDLDVVLSSRDVGPIAGQYSFMMVIMGEDFIAEHHAQAVEFLRAYARAVDYIVENPDEAARLWAANAGIEVLTGLREMNVFPDGGHVQEAGLEFDAELLARYGYLDEEVDISSAIDKSLLDQARAGG